jgi:hypothetical protein
MPRKPSNRYTRSNRRHKTTQMQHDVTTAVFSDVFNVSFAASTSGNIQINGQTSSRMSAMSALYEFYRVVKMKVEVLPLGTAYVGVIAYLPVEPGVPSISSYIDAVQVPTSIALTDELTVPQRMNVPRKKLMGTPERWFSTNSVSSAYSPNQGELLLFTTTAVTLTFTVRVLWTAQYRGPTLASRDLVHNYFLVQKELEQLKQKQQQDESLRSLILARSS